ncbi:uncharacterized protein LOC123353982 [Mauremys mutica]|uniref:uncharacterized protein LOC123353982 n=1 Tax=Mauremys mutica TaxID=74926 RepID=UPI001D169B11|nr:uncharacterized protein LOC123353982 [Mauremys mutica]
MPNAICLLTDQRKWTRGRSRAGAWGLVSRHRLLGTIPDGAGVGQQDVPPKNPTCGAGVAWHRGALAELPQCGRESSPDARVTGMGETPPSHGGQGSRPAQREPQGVYCPKKERSPPPPTLYPAAGFQLQHRTPRPHCAMQPLLLFAKGLDPPPPCVSLSPRSSPCFSYFVVFPCASFSAFLRYLSHVPFNSCFKSSRLSGGEAGPRPAAWGRRALPPRAWGEGRFLWTVPWTLPTGAAPCSSQKLSRRIYLYCEDAAFRVFAPRRSHAAGASRAPPLPTRPGPRLPGRHRCNPPLPIKVRS